MRNVIRLRDPERNARFPQRTSTRVEVNHCELHDFGFSSRMNTRVYASVCDCAKSAGIDRAIGVVFGEFADLHIEFHEGQLCCESLFLAAVLYTYTC